MSISTGAQKSESKSVDMTIPNMRCSNVLTSRIMIDDRELDVEEFGHLKVQHVISMMYPSGAHHPADKSNVGAPKKSFRCRKMCKAPFLVSSKHLHRSVCSFTSGTHINTLCHPQAYSPACLSIVLQCVPSACVASVHKAHAAIQGGGAEWDGMRGTGVVGARAGASSSSSRSSSRRHPATYRALLCHRRVCNKEVLLFLGGHYQPCCINNSCSSGPAQLHA